MTHKPLIIPGNRNRRFDNWVQCTCNGIDECSGHDMCSMIIGYMCGRKSPNYPVPAIPIWVQMIDTGHDETCIGQGYPTWFYLRIWELNTQAPKLRRWWRKFLYYT